MFYSEACDRSSAEVDVMSRFFFVGWAGNANGRFCACGETMTCDEGPTFACNCDSPDDIPHYDHGLFIHKEHLPVSSVCYGYNWSPGLSSYVRIYVGELICAPEQFGDYQ